MKINGFTRHEISKEDLHRGIAHVGAELRARRAQWWRGFAWGVWYALCAAAGWRLAEWWR